MKFLWASEIILGLFLLGDSKLAIIVILIGWFGFMIEYLKEVYY